MKNEESIHILIEKAKKNNNLDYLLEYLKNIAKTESNEISVSKSNVKNKIKK